MNIEIAEETADRIRAFSAKVDALAWAIDTALSALRKDEAGYRQDPSANRGAGRHAERGELEDAYIRAEAFLADLGDLEANVGLPVASFTIDNGAVSVGVYKSTVAGFAQAKGRTASFSPDWRLKPIYHQPARDGIG